jgi:hypothetical protein
MDVRAPSTSTAACMVEVEADAATSDRVPRHAPEAGGLGGRDVESEGGEMRVKLLIK